MSIPLDNALKLAMQDDAAKSLRGDLRDWPLLDVVGWLHDAKRTALLRWENQGLKALLWCVGGEVHACHFAQLSGEAAFLELLEQKSGEFLLLPQPEVTHVANMRMATAPLLLACANLRRPLGAMRASA